MKKRILAIAMCLILCLGLLPAVALANDYEALVSTTNPSDPGTSYATLQEAFTATEAMEPNSYPIVKLLKDVTVSSDLTLNQDINLFLNDCTLTIGSGATLTGNVSAQGYVDHQPMIDLWGGFDSNIGGSLVSSGTIEAFISTYGCEMTVSGGSITAMQMFGGTTTITGGTISDICVDNGTVNISGGSIPNMEVMNNDGGPTVNISGSPVIEQLLLEFYDGNYAGIETVAISGTPQIGLGRIIDCQDQETGIIGSLTITGGLFRTDPTGVFPADTEHVTVSIDEVTDLGAEAGTYRYQVGSGGSGPVGPTTTAAVSAAPTAKTGLKYTGSAQALVNAGTASAGTMQYALGESGSAPASGWSTAIPTASGVGDYNVWYRAYVSESDVTTPARVAVSIAKADGALSFPAATKTVTYGDADFTVAATGAASGSTVSYSSSNEAVATAGAGGAVHIVGVGNATITASASETPTTTAAGAGYALTVNPGSVIVRALNKSIYIGGTLPDLSSPTLGTDYTVSGLASGDTLGGTIVMKYTKSDDPTYVLTPDTTAAGSYLIVIEGAQAPANGNYSGVDHVNGTLTVSAASYYEPEPEPEKPAETTETTENADGSVTEKTTATETEKNADGTETTKTTETATTTAADGSVTETKSETKETLDAGGNGTVEATRTEVVKDADGKVLETTVTESKGTVETDENGTKTTTTVHTATTTDADGNETTTVTTEQKGETADGTTGVVVTDADGNLLSAEATVSEGAVEAAKESGEPVQLPMEVPPVAAEDAENAAPVAITMPAALTDGGSVAEMPRVEITVPKRGPGIVAMIRSALGKLIPIKECYEGSLIVPVPGSCEFVIVDNTKTFGDVAAGAWYEDYVTFVAAREIFNGIGGGAFDPEGSMTRGMVAQVLFNYTRGAVLGDASAFPDISADDWFNGAVGWLVASGVAQGRGEVFDAVSPITREELAVMLFNYAKAQGYDVSVGEDTNILSFSDALDVSDWAYPAMQWAVGAGLIQGADGALLPQAYASRAQVAAMMQRFVENVR